MSDKGDTALVLRPSSELTRISPGASAIIDGMVNDATDIIRVREAIRHKIGDYEFRESDYQQILIWAEAEGVTPDELIASKGDQFVVSGDGAIVAFHPVGFQQNSWGFGFENPWGAGFGEFQWNFWETGLDLSRIPHLEELFCEENGLTALDLSHVPNLKTLSCSKNFLDGLDLSRVPQLKKLFCEDNQVTELDISGLKELRPSVSCDPGVHIHKREDQNPTISRG